MTEQIDKLAAAFLKAQAEFKQPKKNKDNPFFKSDYADLGEIMESSKAALAKNGLLLTQLVTTLENGSTVLKTMLIHTSGQYLESTYPLNTNTKPQAFGSEITYARRYAQTAMLNLFAVDDDGNAAQAAAPPPKPKGRKAPASKKTTRKESINKMVQAFMTLNISETDILRTFDLPEIESLSDDNLKDLREAFTNIKNGNMAANDYFILNEAPKGGL